MRSRTFTNTRKIMKPQSEFSRQDCEIINNDFALLMKAAQRRCTGEDQLKLVQKAFDFANSAHKGVRRRSGEPYILHPISVARIVVEEIGLGHKSICAALLHDVVEDTSYTVEDISNLFGPKIASLVDGLTKIKTVLDHEDSKSVSSQSLQAENFKRILLTLNDDMRVVLIKMADRLHNCRTISFMPEYKRDKILAETMYIFVPLAHKLGLYTIKSEMENIWLRYKEPEAYSHIVNMINDRAIDKEAMIDDFLKPIRRSLDEAGIDYVVKKRVKTPYSIWHKMNTKHVTFDQISDLYAVRIIFTPSSNDIIQERNECFRIFALVTAIYDYRPDRVRDWLMHPKSNGYEALHLTVLTPDRTNVEVQIRTKRMDDIAEKGIAAHWSYKRNQAQSEISNTDKWIARIKEILENPQVNSVDMLDMIHNDLMDSDIFVLDHRGGQHQILQGATALDFGYQQGEEIGNHAIAAKINYKLAPLSQTLRNWDQVEIITSRKEAPKREWLLFLKTEHARMMVKQALGLKDSKIETESDNQKFLIADCCHPIPGDHVVGFLSDDGSIEIHKKTCPVADSLASKYGDRIVSPKWVVDKYAAFPVRLKMNGLDRMGLIHEISSKISQQKQISFKAISIVADGGVFEGYMDIWVHDTQTLESVMNLLSEIKGVQNLRRVDL